MRTAAILLALFALYRWLQTRHRDDSVSLDTIARVEARLRLGEPLPEVDEAELARLRLAWARRRGSRGKVTKFYRPEHRYWRAGA